MKKCVRHESKREIKSINLIAACGVPSSSSLNDKCVRCEAETDNDFGEDTRIYVESLKDGSRQKARYLCADCLAWLDDRIEKFLARSPIELTPKEKELRAYFDT